MRETIGRPYWFGIFLLSFLVLVGNAAGASRQIGLAWDANPQAEGIVDYIVHFGTSSRFLSEFAAYDAKIDAGNVTSVLVDLPSQDETYYVSVVAKNGLGVLSDYSTELVVSPSASPIWVIRSFTGPNGCIDPVGVVAVSAGSSQTFTIRGDGGYRVADVTVDGKSVGPVKTYTFGDVEADHSIAARFDDIAASPSSAPAPPSDPSAAAAPPRGGSTSAEGGGTGGKGGCFVRVSLDRAEGLLTAAKWEVALVTGLSALRRLTRNGRG